MQEAASALDTDVQFLKGVGPRQAVSLKKAGIGTVRDLLHRLPRRYEDRSRIPKISSVRIGEWVTVRGRIVKLDSRPTQRGMVILKAIVQDGSGSITLTWFNQPWIKRALESGSGEVIAYGQVKEAGIHLEIAGPEWEFVGEEDDPEDFARIVPVYPLTDGLFQKTVRRATRSALDKYLAAVQDPLPASILEDQDLEPIRWCLQEIHWPSSESNRLRARKRLVFEEFFYMQVSLAMRRAETHAELGISFPISALLDSTPADPETDDGSPAPHLFVREQVEKREGEALWEQIHRMLPFDLTAAQRRVISEVWADMERPHPMNRLVQGDVGSGKTAVAACAMLAAVRSGYQAALMAPTELLAEQHSAQLQRLFGPLGITVELLVGKLSAAQKRKAAQRTASGESHIAIGTHALIQEGVEFRNLGLVIVDEQHRFGVLQRKALRDKGLGNPDVLVMTATPIPRTLTMTLYGDLDTSVIDELPPGRRPVKTHWKPTRDRDAVYQGVLSLVREGRQAYVVCPMVSESETMMAQAAEELFGRLSAGVFSDVRVGLLHGQMKPKEKEDVMAAFRAHELDVLVSTTVIEVGVDVPNASMMVIEDANRFGLSQLHQLRGRVGRGHVQSYCVLIADVKSEDSRTRMETMRETGDGFKIAEVDLRLRGPGQMAGTQQSGNSDYEIADLVQDARMLEVAREAAIALIERDPHLSLPENSAILAKVRERRSELAVITVS